MITNKYMNISPFYNIDNDLIKYIITLVDDESINKDIYINKYYKSTLLSTGAESFYVSYELNGNGKLRHVSVEYDFFLKYKEKYKEKIRLIKLKKLINVEEY